MSEKQYTLKADEASLIDTIRQAKKEGHADFEGSVKDGIIVRMNWTHKVDLAPIHDEMRRLKENAHP